MTIIPTQRNIDYIFTRQNTQAISYLRPILSLHEHSQQNYSLIILFPVELNITFTKTNNYITSWLYQERLLSTASTNTLIRFIKNNQQIMTSLGALLKSNNLSTANLKRIYCIISYAASLNLSPYQIQLTFRLILPKYLTYPSIKKGRNDDMKQKLIAYLPSIKSKSIGGNNNNNVNNRQLHSSNSRRVVLYRKLLMYLHQNNPNISSFQSTLILDQIFSDYNYRQLYFSSDL